MIFLFFRFCKSSAGPAEHNNGRSAHAPRPTPRIVSRKFRVNYLPSLFSQAWLAIPQLVLHALWQEVWHSPQPPLTALLAISRVFNVTICFMIMSFLKMKLSNCALCRVRLESKTDLLSQCRCIRVKPALTLPYYMDYTHKSQRL